MSTMCRIMSYIRFAIVTIVFISFGFIVNGQNPGDSLSLTKIIGIVVQNHPSVKEMIEAISSADAGIGLAKSRYFL